MKSMHRKGFPPLVALIVHLIDLNVLTNIDRMGKNGGALNSIVLKYFSARGSSNLPYLAFASNVHGGLLPAGYQV